jgi:vacuolar-type H+-ATPase subunit E/Vma4
MKVAEMLNSPHLAGMSVETRRGSVMMALEAAGVDVKDMLQDAMLRNRALEDYEEAQQKKLQDFESAKNEANGKLQAELERVSGEYMRLIQSNVDEVARHQDAFRIWQKNKELELQNMAGASAFCSSTSGGLNGSLAMAAGRRDGRA